MKEKQQFELKMKICFNCVHCYNTSTGKLGNIAIIGNASPDVTFKKKSQFLRYSAF